MEMKHQPVLLAEVIEYMAIKPHGFYVDATFGRGGHTKAILDLLSEKGGLLAIDKDPDAIAYAKQHFSKKDNFYIKQGSFTMLQSFVNELGLYQKIDGVLLDLGVSSPQLDNPVRGFSFLHDGPLDMRMDPNQQLEASTWINTASEEEIARIFWQFGQERYARRIAKAIVKQRAITPLTRTKQLANIISDAHPSWEKHKHPATRCFQAIRIHINKELDELTETLEQALSVLAVGGRLAVISFHSLEDQIVKRFFQAKQRGDYFPRNLPVTADQVKPTVKRIAWGISASDDEVKFNPRSRSAKLRVVEKLQ